VITSVINIHAGYGPEPKVDADVTDGYVNLRRTQSSEDATVAIAFSMNGYPDAVLAELDRMRDAVLDAVNTARAAELLEDFATSADAARETALAYSDGF
jgi:hypothetical protein